MKFAPLKSLLSLAAVLLLTTAPASARALGGVWATDASVGANEVDYRLQLTCPATSLVCSLVDGYDDTQTSSMTGNGTLSVDSVAGTFVVGADSSQDVGSGAQPAYLTLSGSDLTYPTIPFAGVPELVNILVFALTNSAVAPTGLDLETPGDYPFSETLSYSGLAGVVGDLEFILPGIVVPPDDILVSGVFRVLGDLDSDGGVDFEIRDVTVTFVVQSPATIGGEPVTVDITADMTLNLLGELGSPGGAAVPTTGRWGLTALALALAICGRLARVRRRLQTPGNTRSSLPLL
jgi:hypothetical protein